jgi:hypothetical protein
MKVAVATAPAATTDVRAPEPLPTAGDGTFGSGCTLPGDGAEDGADDGAEDGAGVIVEAAFWSVTGSAIHILGFPSMFSLVPQIAFSSTESTSVAVQSISWKATTPSK